MERCPWCKSIAIVTNSPLGYFAECSKNGHVHNIGVLIPVTSCFSKTKDEAEKLWNKTVGDYKADKIPD